MRKNLIINADDYGMSPLWNIAILELARKKIITSISVMIKRNYISFSDFRNLKNISIGLHLELKNNKKQKEIIHQITLFKKKFKKLPSHLDSHHHSHLNKTVLNEVIAVAKIYNLPVRSFSTKKRTLLKKNKIKTPDNYIDWHPNKINQLKKELLKSNFLITELVCHPGYFDKNCDYIYNKSREKELFFLKSREFKNIIKNFTLINYSDL